MEKNANANANADAAPEAFSDQQGGERSPVTVAEVASPPQNHNDDDNNQTPTVVIERSSSSDALPPVATAAALESTTATADLVVGPSSTSHEQGVVVGGGFDAEQGKKRGRGDGGEQQQVVKAAKKKGELTEVPKGEPRCATCNKVFKSWKALFGHLRSHPERTYRGALPPPTAAELDIRRCQQQLASTLLTVAQQVVATASRRGLDIDLNQPSSAADDGGSPEKTGGVGFDLNVEPPPDSDDED